MSDFGYNVSHAATRLGEQLKARMVGLGRTQTALAEALDRPPSRISEFFRSLSAGRAPKDRLTLFLEMADALGLEPVLAPARQLEAVKALIGQAPPAPMTGGTAPSVFDEVFINLGGVHEDDEDPAGFGRD